jgi:hypothetical protein
LNRVWTSPCIRRLVATYGRIVFVILRAAYSLPVALHPASRRRSYLQLSGVSIPRERSFTSLVAPAPGRTDSRLRGNDKKGQKRLFTRPSRLQLESKHFGAGTRRLSDNSILLNSASVISSSYECKKGLKSYSRTAS